MSQACQPRFDLVPCRRIKPFTMNRPDLFFPLIDSVRQRRRCAVRLLLRAQGDMASYPGEISYRIRDRDMGIALCEQTWLCAQALAYAHYEDPVTLLGSAIVLGPHDKRGWISVGDPVLQSAGQRVQFVESEGSGLNTQHYSIHSSAAANPLARKNQLFSTIHMTAEAARRYAAPLTFGLLRKAAGSQGSLIVRRAKLGVSC